MPRDELVALDDGRRVAIRNAGAQAGPLVLYAHGSPSSRLDVDYMDERAARRGVRLVGFDRPGYGNSDFMPFTFESVAADAAAVADFLGAAEFTVFGQSTGVAYALAVAAFNATRVTAVATAGGGSPFEPGTPAWDHLSPGEQRGISLIGVDDDEAKRLMAEADKPFVAMLDGTDDDIETAWMPMLPPADQRVFRAGLGKLIGPTMRAALKQGQLGWAHDNIVWAARWDFDLGAVTSPATFWVGEQDGGRVDGARWLSKQIPHGDLRIMRDEGHFVGFELFDEVLDSLRV